MSQWGEERRFIGDPDVWIIVLPNVDTGGAFDPINLESTISNLFLMSVGGDRALAEQLFERVKQQYEGRPYAEWRRPGPPRPLPQPAPVSGGPYPPPLAPKISANFTGPFEHKPPAGYVTLDSNSGARESFIHEAIPCMIRQAGDSTWCQTAGCGLRWDTNEADPPRCPRIAVQQVRRSAATRVAPLSPYRYQRGSRALLYAALLALGALIVAAPWIKGILCSTC